MDEQRQLEAYVERLAGDLEFFATELWDAIGMPPLARHQAQQCRWLQHGPYRRGIRAFRGASKTWLTLAYCLWLWFNNPQERVLLISKSEKHSRDSLFMVRRWINQVPWLHHLAPDRRAGQRDSATKFDVGPADDDRSPSFTAASVSGQITGSRATLVILDDAETSENSLSAEMRDRLRDQVREVENVLVPNGPGCVVLGTPHHQESLYDGLREGGYAFQAWPCRYPSEAEKTDDLADAMIEDMDSGFASIGDPTWPTRFTSQELAEREGALGRSAFNMQMMLRTHAADGDQHPLKLSDLIVHPVNTEQAPLTIAWGQTNDRGGTTRIQDIRSLGFSLDGFYAPIMFSNDWAKYTGTYMWIDPSGKGADRTAFAIVSHLNGTLYCHAVGGLDGGYSSMTLEGLALQAQTHRVNRVYIESNFGTGMLEQLFQPVLQRHFIPRGDERCPDGWAASIEGVRVSGQKEVRVISALEPICNQHRLVMDPSVARNEELQRQFTRITRDRNCLRHDDEVEALAMCVKMWEEVMSADPQRGASRHRDMEQKARLREQYMALGKSMGGTRWFQHQGAN